MGALLGSSTVSYMLRPPAFGLELQGKQEQHRRWGTGGTAGSLLLLLLPDGTAGSGRRAGKRRRALAHLGSNTPRQGLLASRGDSDPAAGLAGVSGSRPLSLRRVSRIVIVCSFGRPTGGVWEVCEAQKAVSRGFRDTVCGHSSCRLPRHADVANSVDCFRPHNLEWPHFQEPMHHNYNLTAP